VKFITVADYFYKIEQESSRLAMTKLLAELFAQADSHEAALIAYLSLGTLRAPYQGTKFNFALKGMQEVIAQVRGMSLAQVEAAFAQSGDLGSVVAQEKPEPGPVQSNFLYQVPLVPVSLVPGTEGPVHREQSLQNVYDELVAFEQISGTGSFDEKIAAACRLLRLVSPREARYIVRIMVQNLRLGFSEMTIIDALSWMLAGDKSLREQIEYAYNVSADIGLIAEKARSGGLESLKKLSITVGIPICPAAAERLASARDIIEKIGPCVAQPKFDGFRLQVHIDNTQQPALVKFFSRNLQDMSPMFPDLLAALSAAKVQTLVAEGEALAFDEQTGSYLPFQETVKRRRKYDILEMAQELPLRLVFFDLLYLDGVSLLPEPERERYKLLQKLFGHAHNPALAVSEQQPISTAEELERYFFENITAGLEGLVVKRPDASYQPGKRNFNWIKLKRHEQGHLDDTIDAVILGYYQGRGKRASFGIGAFLVGLYNKSEDRFESVAKVGTGLSDEAWRDLRARCDAHAVQAMPHNVLVASTLAPDVWVAPEIVVAIRADEITRSPVHTAGAVGKQLGLALRFPRFMAYRTDKSATEATSVVELQALYAQQNTPST